MRSFLRHPSDIPIEVQLDEPIAIAETDSANNISRGGLSFNSRVPLREGSVIRLRIPVVRPVYEVLGRVTWCHGHPGYFEAGVQFLDQDDYFQARMVEQVCHIEHYKRSVLEREGRALSGEEAALEWIERYAPAFPPLEEDEQG